MTLPLSEHVHVEQRGFVGHIRLARPEKINALTVEMIRSVAAALSQWADDDTVTAVMITGDGDRGLCAGGDIAAVYRGIRGEIDDPATFWRDEYRMNLQIAEYPKPVIAIMHGLVLGGGLGISGHASVRIVTENSQIAMPETAIGLSPDVGGLYLLSRAPGELGTHAALTGARLGASDAIAAGLADFFIPSHRLSQLITSLWQIDDSGPAPDQIAARIGELTQEFMVSLTAMPAAPIWPAAQEWIDACYASDDPAEIARRLQERPESEAADAAATLAHMSPTAVAVTLRALRQAREMTLAQVLEQDLMLCTAFARHPDFAEGIRAQIVDKDHAPTWQPASIDELDREGIDAFFMAAS